MEKKIVFITGASSGIGEGCARKFAMNGYRLILNGRNVEKLAAVKRELETEYHADVCLLPFDVRDRRAAAAALDSLPEAWKAIDILINNAGLVIGVDKEHEGSLDEWDVVIDTNVKSLLAMTRLVVPGMVERGRGHVINMGSIAGDYGKLTASGPGFLHQTVVGGDPLPQLEKLQCQAVGTALAVLRHKAEFTEGQQNTLQRPLGEARGFGKITKLPFCLMSHQLNHAE